jgi:hypothetical protein
MLNKSLVLLFCLVLFASSSFAYTVNVSYDNSTAWNTSGLTGFATNASQMNGMIVTATFTDNTTQTASWTHSDTSGSAGSAGFNLTQNGGSTYSYPWNLTSNNALRSLQIDAGAGNTVFDAIYPTPDNDSSLWGSPGSAQGYFDVTDATGYSQVNATFSGQVKVTNVFYGDLYRYLTFDFVIDNTFTPDQHNPYGLTFLADTDSLSSADDITPSVPEPSTLFLLGGGLAGLFFLRKKQRK